MQCSCNALIAACWLKCMLYIYWIVLHCSGMSHRHVQAKQDPRVQQQDVPAAASRRSSIEPGQQSV